MIGAWTCFRVCRSYYKCTNPRCNAKKQVEKSSDDPDTLIVTYEGLHLHFAYPFSPVGPFSQPINRPKNIDQAHKNDPKESNDFPQVSGGPKENSQKAQAFELAQDDGMGYHGLLQAVVPIGVLNPDRTDDPSPPASSWSSPASTSSQTPPASPPYPPSYFVYPPPYYYGCGLDPCIT